MSAADPLPILCPELWTENDLKLWNGKTSIISSIWGKTSGICESAVIFYGETNIWIFIIYNSWTFMSQINKNPKRNLVINIY